MNKVIKMQEKFRKKELFQQPEKPVIRYSHLENLRGFIKKFYRTHKNWEDIIDLAHYNSDKRVIKGIDAKIDICTSEIDNRSVSLITKIEGNLNFYDFLNKTEIEKTISGEIVGKEDDDYSMWLWTKIYESGLEIQNSDRYQLEKRIYNHEYDVNNLLSGLFAFYGINGEEKEINFNFSQMNRLYKFMRDDTSWEENWFPEKE